MPNVKQIIDGHNKATLKKDAQPQHDETTNTCNCRKKDECPLEGECLTKEIIYQAAIKTKDTTETDWQRPSLRPDGETTRCRSNTRKGRMILSSVNICGN